MRHFKDLAFLIFQLARIAGMAALLAGGMGSICTLCWLGDALAKG